MVYCQKIKLQARADEIESSESVRIYHHELHKKHLKRTSILKLDTGDKILEGHAECANFLENSVADLLLNQASLCNVSQEELLKDVQPVFTKKDNDMLRKSPSKDEVKKSIWTANLHAAPGTDGLTTFLYYICWDILGNSLTEMVQAIHDIYALHVDF